MSAPPYMKPGCSRRLEIHHGNFACVAYHFTAVEVGELIQMLMAEAGEIPIPPTDNAWVAAAFAKRRLFSKIKGSFGREALPLSVRTVVFKRDSQTCQYCSRALTWADYHCDHVHPVSKGGGDALDNLAAACEACNRSKGAKTLSEWGAAQ